MPTPTKIVKRRIRLRQDTKANFESYNKTPALGEPCYETDTGYLKIGDGTHDYVHLPYLPADKAKDYVTGGNIESSLQANKNLVGVKTYSASLVYNLNDIVETVNSSDETKLYRSLVDNNTGNPLSDTTKWGEVLLGSATDNISITENTDRAIQAIGVMNGNNSGNALKIWTGSQLDYDSMPSHDPHTLYITPNPLVPEFLPVGTILPFAGSVVPRGFLLCDGSALSKTTYARLYEAIGDAYNTGSELEGTFRLPIQVPFIIETKETTTGEYTVYSNGYYEERGFIPIQTWRVDDFPVTLSKTMKNANYSLITDKQIITTATSPISAFSIYTKNKTTTGFTTAVDQNVQCNWQVRGFLAENQYSNKRMQIIKY